MLSAGMPSLALIFGVGHGRVVDGHDDQLLAAGGQVGERFAQRCAALGQRQFMLGDPALPAGDVPSVQPIPGGSRSAR